MERDSKIENTCLLPMDTLIEMLMINTELPLSPLSWEKLFQQSGIITLQDLTSLKYEVSKTHNFLRNAFFILNNMDYLPRSIDEIKGRLDVKWEQEGQETLSKKELVSLLGTLCSAPFNLIRQDGEVYSAIFPVYLAKRRINSILKFLYNPSNFE